VHGKRRGFGQWQERGEAAKAGVGASLRLCIVGASHARYLSIAINEAINASGSVGRSAHIDARFMDQRFGSRHRVHNASACSHLLLHYGQWDLSFQAPMYRGKLRNGGARGLKPFGQLESDFADRLAELPRRRVWVLTMNYNPPSCDISACPPLDWRHPALVDELNLIFRRQASAWRVPLISTTDIIGPMWDAAPDWSHPRGVVLEAIVARILSHICPLGDGSSPRPRAGNPRGRAAAASEADLAAAAAPSLTNGLAPYPWLGCVGIQGRTSTRAALRFG
jgi:hypothetical protein